jgi:uncharacterized Zn-finger protein
MRIPSITTDKPSASDGEDLALASYKEISAADLPLYCPAQDKSLWNTHPRVYLPIKQNSKAICPYCSTMYELKEPVFEDR